MKSNAQNRGCFIILLVLVFVLFANIGWALTRVYLMGF